MDRVVPEHYAPPSPTSFWSMIADSMPVESCQKTLSTMEASLATVRFITGMMYMSRLRSMKMSWRSALVPV